MSTTSLYKLTVVFKFCATFTKEISRQDQEISKNSDEIVFECQNTTKSLLNDLTILSEKSKKMREVKKQIAQKISEVWNLRSY